MQQVQYTYYDGTQNGGNLGDLMTATVEDGDDNVLIDQLLPLLHGGPGQRLHHGLEYVVNPASYAADDGGLGTDLSSLTDAQVAAYADNYFQYDAAARDARGRARGRRRRTRAGGRDTYSYTASSNTPGENSWAIEDGGDDPGRQYATRSTPTPTGR